MGRPSIRPSKSMLGVLLMLLISTLGLSQAHADRTHYRATGITSGIAATLESVLQDENRKLAAFACDQNGEWALATEDGAHYYSKRKFVEEVVAKFDAEW